jgi:hypothetical protein
MQHPFRPVPLNHAGSAAPDAQPGCDAERHWHTVLGERPCSALPDDDLDYFLRRPQVAAPAAAPAHEADPTAHAMAAAFAT